MNLIVAVDENWGIGKNNDRGYAFNGYVRNIKLHI